MRRAEMYKDIMCRNVINFFGVFLDSANCADEIMFRQKNIAPR